MGSVLRRFDLDASELQLESTVLMSSLVGSVSTVLDHAARPGATGSEAVAIPILQEDRRRGYMSVLY